jgi:hypothetical protein
MTGLQTKTESMIRPRSTLASSHNWPKSVFIAVRTAAVISAAPDGFIIE